MLDQLQLSRTVKQTREWVSSCLMANQHKQAIHRVPTLLLKKNPGLFQDPRRNFPGPLRSPGGLHIRKNGENIYSHCSKYGPAQRLFTACSKVLLNVDIRYALEAIEKYAVFKNIFPGLSRSWIFQEKNPWLSRSFQEAWEPCIQCHTH